MTFIKITNSPGVVTMKMSPALAGIVNAAMREAADTHPNASIRADARDFVTEFERWTEPVGQDQL